MKSIASIFEGIFDQNTDRLENRAMLDDPNSEFSKEWGSQVFVSHPHSNDFKKFEISDNLLIIGDDTIDMRDTVTVYHKYPLTKYLPDIGGIRTNGALNIHMRGHSLTPDIFGGTISSYMYIYIDGLSSIHDMQFEGNAIGDINKKMDIYDCINFSNCIFDGITQIGINHVPQISNFTKCKSDTLLRMSIEGDDIFKNQWPEFENLVDYNALDLPVNGQTGKQISTRIMNLPKMANIVKYCTKYTWGNHKAIPLNVSGQNIVKKLFPGCHFPCLENIAVIGQYASLNIDIKKSTCYIQSRNDRPASRRRRY